MMVIREQGVLQLVAWGFTALVDCGLVPRQNLARPLSRSPRFNAFLPLSRCPLLRLTIAELIWPP